MGQTSCSRTWGEVGENDSAFDVLTGQQQPVPSALFYATGIECDTLSTLNSQARIGDGVVSSGEGKTGTTAQATIKYVQRRLPDLVLFECVKGLGAAPKGGSSSSPKLSDLDVLISLLNKKGYIFLAVLTEASEWGSCTSRPRYYIMGMRVLMEDDTFSQLPQPVPGSEEVKTYTFP